MHFEIPHFSEDKEFIIKIEETEENSECNVPIHIQRAFEYYRQLEGTSEIVVGSSRYTLEEGKAVLVFPFQPHSFFAKGYEKHEYCVFLPDIVPDYFKSYMGMIPEINIFDHTPEFEYNAENEFLSRSIAYSICGSFFEKMSKGKKIVRPSGDFITEVLLWVEKNFREKFSLASIAKELGCDYSYLSKQFKNKVGIPFNRYVNILRVREAQFLIRTTNSSLGEIMIQCGFSSHRSFDRNFMFFVGSNPSEYKKKYSTSSQRSPEKNQ